MTGHEHYREAERLLSHIGRSGLDVKESQVHATLALVAATREIGDQLDRAGSRNIHGLGKP